MRLFNFILILILNCLFTLSWTNVHSAHFSRISHDTVYVSSLGDDVQGQGTSNRPYYSLNKAIEGKLATTKNSDTLFVLVASGDYYMQQPFTIQESSSRPIIIKGQGTQKPRFLGGIRVGDWEKCDNGMYRAYIPEVARYGLDFEQFYVNGQRATLARTPNVGWYQVKGSSEQPFIKGNRIADYAVQKINFQVEDWSSLAQVSQKELKNMKFRYYHKWDITRKRPQYIEKDSAYIYMQGKGMKPWNPIQNGSRYFMYDYKAALDVAGEWYLDRASSYIYYMPQQGEDMTTAYCIAPVLHQWVSFKGKKDKVIKNVTFEGLSFQYASYLIPESGEEPMQAAANSEVAMQFEFSDHITIQDCEILHTGAYGIGFGQECHDNTIRRCYIADLGAGGIKIGEPYFRVSMDNVTSRNTIDNNIITSGGHELPCGVGIAMFHTSDNNVTHNEISDILYSGISVGWVWGYNSTKEQLTPVMGDNGMWISVPMKLKSPAVRNTVMYNHVHHIGWGELSDMGAVYTLGESPGTRISYNVIHDVFTYDYGGWGLYTDEGSTGIEMSHNLVYRCKSGGFHQHYGKENKIINNIFAFAHTNQLQCTRAEDHLSFTFQRNLILLEEEALFKNNWEKAKINADYNVYWSTVGAPDFYGKTFEMWKKTKEPHSIMRDPQFKNPKEDDFRFKSMSVAKKVGFKSFDYSQAGVYGDREWTQKANLSQERKDAFIQIVNQYKLNKK